MLAGDINLCVHDLIIFLLFHAVGFSSIVFIYSVTSDVSSSGGKYGRRRYTLNNGCMPRKGGILN
jgi:hypothetical protein